MKTERACIGITGLLALSCLSVGLAQASIVFDNTNNPAGATFGPGCCHVGNEITLGSSERKIDQVSWLIDSQDNDVIVGFETQIFANDGANGSPGTLLWQSGALTGINVSATDTTLDIAVPRITVPEVITVTSKILDSLPVALGRVDGGPPSVGSVNTSWIETSPGEWAEQFGPYGMQIRAVPEPSIVLLMTVGMAGFGLSRRRNKPL